MGALNILKHGSTCDHLQGLSGVSGSTWNHIFHTFTAQFKQRKLRQYIKFPDAEELARSMSVYDQIGFPGCCSSTDCTHIYWDRCPAQMRSLASGKENRPTVVYSASVDHARKIFNYAGPFYGTVNDKSISLYDKWLKAVPTDPLFTEVTYELYDKDGVKNTYRGAWVMCDGGYHKFRYMQCPLKYSSSDAIKVWSGAVESARKDVECIFGLLKARFSILKKPFQYQTVEQVDNAVVSCMILHNMLLSVNGWEDIFDEDRDFSGDEREGAIHVWRTKRQKVSQRKYVKGGSIRRQHAARGMVADDPLESLNVVNSDDVINQPGYHELQELLVMHYDRASYLGKVRALGPQA